MIHLTEEAIQLIYKTKESQNIKDEVGIRLTALSEDDLGPSYDIQFDYRRDDDHIFGPEGAELFVTDSTLTIMDGGTFDVGPADGGVAFKITNPNYVREISSSGGCSGGGCSSGGCSSGGCSSGGCSSGGCSSGGCCSK